MLIQTLAYPILAAFVERGLFYKNSRGRKMVYDNVTQPIVLSSFTKHYSPNWWFRLVAPIFGIKKVAVKAVNDVSLAPMQGQIMVLVGANGCGKSTTLVRSSRLWLNFDTNLIRMLSLVSVMSRVALSLSMGLVASASVLRR